MKIGILTFYESDNYGTVLQAFALQQYLESKGHQAELIRIRRSVNAVSAHFDRSGGKREESLWERIRIKYSTIRHAKDEEKKKAAFRRFRETRLNVSGQFYETDEELLRCPPVYDLYISGGDQIWNPYHKVFSTHYMFDFLPDGCPKASYGSSFGVSAIKERDVMDTMSRLLRTYQCVSVRERSGVELLNEMGIGGELVLDPVFLIDDCWSCLADGNKNREKEPYCLVYALVDYPKEEDRIIRAYAERRGWKVLVLPANRHNHATPYRKSFSAGPEEFVGLLANAEHVFTNSFHGLAFSVLFKRQFSLLSTVSKESESKKDRLTNLVAMLELPGRPVNAEPEIIDYDAITPVLKRYQAKSYAYIDRMLGACGTAADTRS